ncbi:ATP-binding protein [Solitalea sp. MAHUQ-68]|uniref:ATP-binding protein n=1 Tax=Solitalea agri TaxID=2953739 RepID=A0A9X2F8U2_9SPHI|nr:ATP-binding protein [Solitalea agri]MCO4294466.1 ATP-binding protein [Solitalea agri]
METYHQNITNSLSFLQETINRRLHHFFNKESDEQFSYPEIKLEEDNAPLNQFLAFYQVNIEEYIILLLALAPHIQPTLLDTTIQTYLPNGGDFPEIGGVKGNNHRGTIPTGETALFILGGHDIAKRMQTSTYFSPDHFFAKENILSIEQLRDGEPRMSGKIVLQQDYIDLFTIGSISKPTFGPDFPAKNISTKLNWTDLILNQKTQSQIEDIKIWLNHNRTLLNDWEMDNKIKPGYRALFYGHPGTGKTLTAALLGKQFKKEVYRIDLSQIVSKYIGETEKNLEKVFNKAEHKNWILFFDEADALFGKRTNVQNAHDKYANQEVSYLLQRVEDFPGLIILASNYKSNIDQAFVRRFNAIIHFPIPNPQERLELWKSSVPSKAVLANDIDLKTIAHKYELSGSAIVNVIHYASLQTIHQNSITIQKADILEGIKREYEKEEKVFVA